MSEWTWYACDFPTGKLITELPLSTNSLSAGLNMIGAANFTLPLGEPNTPDEWEEATEPRRTVIVGEVQGKILWAGIIWYRTRSDGDTIELQTSTLESFWARRYVDTQLGPYVNEDQAVIALGLIHHAQLVKGFGADLPWGVVYEVFNTGVKRDRQEYNRYADQKLYDMIDNLAKLDDGFEWTVSVDWADGVIPKRLRYTVKLKTQLGNVTDKPTTAFEYPGNVVSWSLDEDYTEDAYANVVVAGGEGEEDSRIMSTSGIAQDADSLAYGNPMVEYRLQTQLTTQAGVDAAAKGMLATMKNGAHILTLSVKTEDLLAAGNLQLGDTVKVVLEALSLPVKYERNWRVVAWTIDPASGTLTPTLNPY